MKGSRGSKKREKIEGKKIVELSGNSEFNTAVFSKIHSEMSPEWDGKAAKGHVKSLCQMANGNIRKSDQIFKTVHTESIRYFDAVGPEQEILRFGPLREEERKGEKKQLSCCKFLYWLGGRLWRHKVLKFV